MNANYKKIEYTNGNSEWGAYIELGYGRNAYPAPKVGEEITITTKRGEKHVRTIARVINQYSGSMVVTLINDAEVARIAEERLAAAKAASAHQRPAARHCAAEGRNYDGSIPCPRCGTYCYGDCTSH